MSQSLRDSVTDTSGTVPFDVSSLRRVTGLVFSMPRAYTVAMRGGLDLVLHSLRAHGLVREADRLVEAVTPLVDAVGAAGVLGLPEALLARAGGPSSSVKAALRNDDLETALAAAFDALGWPELRPTLASWSPTANGAVAGLTLDREAQWDRRRLVLGLMRRATEIDAAWDLAPDPWSWGTMPVDGRTVKSAARALGFSVAGEVASSAEVPLASRHANRMGRAMVALALSRLPAALRGHAPQELVRRALSLFAALAESLLLEPVDGVSRPHVLSVVDEGAPVRFGAWTPAMWWPVLDAWGSSSKEMRAMTSTSWRLPTVDADVVMWAISYAMSLVMVCADTPEGRVTAEQWAVHEAGALDPVWGLRCEAAWELFQSSRPVSARAPWPSPFGSGSAFSVVNPAAPSSLPWVSVDGES